MSIRHVFRTVAVSAPPRCAALCSRSVWVRARPAHPLISSDGNTTLNTIGTVTAGTPYSSGQTIKVNGVANSTLNNTNLGRSPCRASSSHPPAPGRTQPAPPAVSSTSKSAPTRVAPVADLPDHVEWLRGGDGRLHVVSKTTDGSFDDPAFTVYDLPDPGTLGSATMTGTCDVAPNQCVIGIFAAEPAAGNRLQLPPPLLGAVPG